MPRISFSKKIRFDVFKRDNFKCQYCGGTPPIVVLEIDHIVPVSKNGTNEIDNLATSCFNCNRGKGSSELNVLPQTTIEKSEQIKEKEDQYKEFKKIQNKIRKRLNKEISQIDDLYNSYFNQFRLNDRFKNGSIKTFINKLGFHSVYNSMEISCGKIYDKDEAIKYFCGICWNKIKNPGNE